MKKTVIALLLTIIMLISSLAGLAEVATELPEASALPEIGATLHGFTVKEHYALEDLDATCAYMVHDKTGAQLTYIANEDTNRMFNITFRTPTKDNKGIPHVFEHATLCGSDKYPDPSLFVNMIYQTYNTYLNAATMQSCTSYPAASLSEEQLYVYTDYILSGVSNPLIMNDVRAMMREAYRYELKDADSDITLAGTVYSEMKGALTPTAYAMYNYKTLLYPGSITANIAGGDPAVIPDITHQELKDFHDDYYHPSNSMLVLYGKLDLDKFLTLIDEEYLSKYERREITLTDDAYEPFTGYREQVYSMPVAADAAIQPLTIYGISLENATIKDRVLIEIIANALSVESSPFQKRYREKLPNATMSVGVDKYSTDFSLLFYGANVSEADKDIFKALTDEAIAEVLTEGLDMSAVESQCRKRHYSDIIGRGQVSVGIMTAMDVGTEWGNTENPFAYKEMADTYRNLMTYVGNDAFNETFRRLMKNPVRSAIAISVPEAGGLERQSEALADKLKDMKAAMTAEEIDALVAVTADFDAWTQGNKDNSMIDKMKAVSIQTLPEELTRFEAKDYAKDGMRVVSSEVAMDDVINVCIGFDASSLRFDQLQDYAVLASLMKDMPTRTHSKAQLMDALTDAAYSLNVTCNTIDYKKGGYMPTFSTSFITTQDKLESCFALLEEMIYSIDLSDAELLRQVLKEKLYNIKMMASLVPEYLTLSYGMPLISESRQYTGYLTGDESLNYQQRITEMTDEEIAALTERMAVILDTLLNKNGFYVTCVGTAESIDQAVECASKLYAKLDDQKHESIDYTGLLPDIETPLASVIDSTVQFNMLIASMKDSGFEENGKMLAMNQLMKDKILMQVLRFQNAAYGVLGLLDGSTVYVCSYRDPNLAETYAVYNELGDRIRALKLTQDDLDGYIAGVYSVLASPMSEIVGGSQAVLDALTGETTFDNFMRYMKELKQFCPEDVITYSAVYDMLAEKGKKVTIGGAEAIEKNRDMFKTILTTYVE